MATSSSSPAARLLARQLNEIKHSKNLQGISCGLVDEKDLFTWEVILIVNDDCKYYGGKASPTSSSRVTTHHR